MTVGDTPGTDRACLNAFARLEHWAEKLRPDGLGDEKMPEAALIAKRCMVRPGVSLPVGFRNGACVSDSGVIYGCGKSSFASSQLRTFKFPSNAPYTGLDLQRHRSLYQ